MSKIISLKAIHNLIADVLYPGYVVFGLSKIISLKAIHNIYYLLFNNEVVVFGLSKIISLKAIHNILSAISIGVSLFSDCQR